MTTWSKSWRSWKMSSAEDLNVIEQAEAYRSLINRGYTRERAPRKRWVSSNPWRIDERLALLNLRDEYKRLVISGEIGPSEAFHMTGSPKTGSTSSSTRSNPAR